MPSVNSKFMRWVDNAYGISSNSIKPYIIDSFDAKPIGAIKGKCFLNALCLKAFLLKEFNITNEEQHLIKIVAGVRFYKDCNDRWVGDTTKNITKHFWVEFENKVYDFAWTNRNCLLYIVSVPNYYRVRNICDREIIQTKIGANNMVGTFTKSSLNENKDKFYGITLN